jgi:hypothetical protein
MKQFLTDAEYEDIKRDVRTILDDVVSEANAEMRNGQWHVDVTTVGKEGATAKLTAYIDQKVAEYY